MNDEQMIRAQVTKAILDLAKAAKLQPGAQIVIGCSTSEIAGGQIGKASVPEIGEWMFALTKEEASPMEEPCLVMAVQADAGIDIGDTLIGMHLRPVAVPYRGEIRKIGQANLVCAWSRLPYVGGERAVYK